MARTTITLSLLFLWTVLVLLLSYINWNIGVKNSLDIIFESIPVLKASFFLTLALPIYLLFAFYTSKQFHNMYSESVVGLSILVPIGVFLLVLPGKLDTPDVLKFRMGVNIFLVVLGHYIASQYLKDAFWVQGGGKKQA